MRQAIGLDVEPALVEARGHEGPKRREGLGLPRCIDHEGRITQHSRIDEQCTGFMQRSDGCAEFRRLEHRTVAEAHARIVMDARRMGDGG